MCPARVLTTYRVERITARRSAWFPARVCANLAGRRCAVPKIERTITPGTSPARMPA